MTKIEIYLPEHLEHSASLTAMQTRPWVWLYGVLAGMFIVFVGMAAIFGVAVWDFTLIADKPWKSAFIFFEIPPDLPNLESYPVKARMVHRREPLEDDITLKLLEKVVSGERFDKPLRLSDPELVVALELPEEKIIPLLASGRLPEPGKPEVLAGSLARDESFQVDDVEFTVTGRLADSVSGFLFSYMLPHISGFEHLFPEDPKTANGLLVIFDDPLLASEFLPENPHLAKNNADAGTESREPVINDDVQEPTAEETEKNEVLIVPPFVGGTLRAHPAISLASIFGLFLAALGGVVFHYSLFRWLHGIHYRPVFAILDMIVTRPVLYWATHLLFYGVFFMAMYESIANPLLSYRISQYIQAVFSEGGLGYIGAAYASGDVVHAAWATFYNNYIEQTLGFTFLISLFPIPLGVIKNLMSFALVGGALAPLWVGASQAYVLHSITMVLELQAYIIACFAVMAWPLHLLKGLWIWQPFNYIKSGLVMLFAAALLTGVMLGIAAFYEAYTLIYLMGP